jgi:lipoprotein-anchoring transpeptidase ErfK/SrfK
MGRFMTTFAAVGALALLSGCTEFSDGEEEASRDTAATSSQDADYGYETYGEDNLADTMASNDGDYASGTSQANASDMSPSDAAGPTPAAGATPASENSGADTPDSKARPIMQAQVVLDRAGFGPGIIDGKMGMSTENALSGFQEAKGLEVTGALDDATKEALSEWDRIPATRVVTIPESWADAEFSDIPEEPAQMAKLDKLGYKSLDERLAERFHTTVAVLKELNPGGKLAEQDGPSPNETPDVEQPSNASLFRAGQQVRVPNIGADRIAPGSLEDRDWQRTLASLGVGSEQTEVDRIVVSKSGNTLKAYQGEELVALFTVSSGSSEFPLPLGEWDILGEAYNPPYSYDPEVLGQREGETYTFPPGPNSPVGVVWIDLSKEHYGLHGTPEPETIGRAQSSGCVRLTNWDAARLAMMVSQSTQVIFEA